MARIIQSVPELYTDQIIESGGGAYEISFHMRVIFEGGDPDGEWHYFGTIPEPQHPDAIQHAAIHFPAMMTIITGSEGQGLFFDLAIHAGRIALES
ncbi:MAG: hypothetical protein PVJ86_00060 [Phycisphaerales bacterium]|jgi:hypothetical protein